MQITGMLHGARLLELVGFPATEVLGPDATEQDIKSMLDRHGQIFIKPVFKGGVGKKERQAWLGKPKISRACCWKRSAFILRAMRVGVSK
ncbi:hypothetical protein ACE0DR_11360 [Azotobacter sp. CWF10]